MALWALGCVDRDARPDQRGHPKHGRLPAAIVGDQCSHPVIHVECRQADPRKRNGPRPDYVPPASTSRAASHASICAQSQATVFGPNRTGCGKWPARTHRQSVVRCTASRSASSWARRYLRVGMDEVRDIAALRSGLRRVATVGVLLPMVTGPRLAQPDRKHVRGGPLSAFAQDHRSVRIGMFGDDRPLRSNTGRRLFSSNRANALENRTGGFRSSACGAR